MHRLALIVVLGSFFAMFASSQALDSNSITVSANRNLTNLQPDQVVFGVFVNAPPSAGFVDVLASVQSLGLTAANFSTVNTTQSPVVLNPLQPTQPAPVTPAIEWAFNLAVPVSKVKDTVAALGNLQKSIGQNNPGYAVSFRVQTTQVSQQLQQAQTCSVPDLLVDARAQAQKLADAAGLNLGAVLAMSGATAINAVPSSVAPYSIPPICTITVKFTASRY